VIRPVWIFFELRPAEEAAFDPSARISRTNCRRAGSRAELFWRRWNRFHGRPEMPIDPFASFQSRFPAADFGYQQ
jgi:hypothetical protein